MTAEAFSGSAVAAVVTVVTTTAEDTLKGISSAVVVEHFGDYNSGRVCLVPPWPVFLITSPAHPWLRVCYVCRACSWGAGGALRELAETSSRNCSEREGQGTLSTPAGPRGSGTAHLFRVRKKIGRDTTSFVCRGGGTAPG